MSAPATDQAETLRLIRAAGRKAGAMAGVPPEDVVQDLWILYNRKLAALYTPSLPLYPLLAEAARRIAFGYTHRRFREVSQADMSEGDGEDNIASLATESDPTEDAERRIALATLGNMLAPIGNPDRTLGLARFAGHEPQAEENSVTISRRPKKPRAERSLSANQIRLREIRLSLKMTLKGFSTRIGASEASQRAYEYGVTHDVPSDVMKRAEQLFESVGVQRTPQRAAILDTPIDVLMQTWATRLGVTPDPVVLAEAMNNIVSGNTLRRWLAKKHTPVEANLLAVDGYSRYGAQYLSVEKAKSLWRMMASSRSGDGICLIPEEAFRKLSAVLKNLASDSGYIGEASRQAEGLLQDLLSSGGGFKSGVMTMAASAFSPFADRMKESIFWHE